MDIGRAELTVETADRKGVTVVELAGELDVTTAGDLRAALQEIDLDGGIEVRTDLSRLEFLDSSGMGVLVSACRRIREAGGAFSAVCGDGEARRALEIAGLLGYLGVA
jgi:anti-sigma B factor antagonist